MRILRMSAKLQVENLAQFTELEMSLLMTFLRQNMSSKTIKIAKTIELGSTSQVSSNLTKYQHWKVKKNAKMTSKLLSD